MTDNELIEFIDFLNHASDDDIINMLKDTNRIREENLSLACKLLRKIITKEGQNEIVDFLIKDHVHGHNVVGAIDPAFMLLQPQTIAELTHVYANKITGSDLYCLWNDCANRDYRYYMLNIWAMMSGVYSKNEIEDNFRVNHISFDHMTEDDSNWFNRQPRAFVRPFVFDDTIINITDYVNDVHNFEPFGEDFKKFVKSNRSLQILLSYLGQSGLRYKNYVFTDKDEISLTIVMPTLKEQPYRRSTKWVQEENGVAETFVLDTNQVTQLAINRPTSKFFNEIDKSDLCKSLYFLKYAKKHFLPGLAVIRGMPIENIANFYANNNDKRYGDIISHGKFNDLHSQIGIFNLSYILGLFNASETESTLASDYIKNYVINRVPVDDIHKLYGGLDISSGYNKNFADFFMLHHSQDIHCFEDINGSDKTNQIYHSFDAILAFRSEKKIKTTTNRERLTPEDAINALKSGSVKFGLPAEYDPYIEVISQYTSDVNEMMWIIERLEAGKDIPSERISIPYIEDTAHEPFRFRVLKKGDPEMGIVGKKTNCCFEYNNASENALDHALTNENSSVVVFEAEKSYVQGWLWYDAINNRQP